MRRHAIVVQGLDFRGNYHPSAAAKYLDMTRVVLAQHIHDVLEKFDMPPLIGADRYTLDIFLQGSLDDFGHRAIVRQVESLQPRMPATFGA